MPCSAVTLSLATVVAILSSTLLVIAFSTDNWVHIEVKRSNIQQIATKKGGAGQELLQQLNSKYYYYTRTKGLFRICFPKERPSTVETYLSPVETHCMNMDYFFPDTSEKTKNFSEYATTRLYMGRSAVILFAFSFLVLFISFWTGIAGCWRRSPANITATAILILLSCLLAAGAMGFWHGVEYYEKERYVGEEYFKEWNEVLRENTTMSYDWSLYIAWSGVISLLVSAILFLGSAMCLRSEHEQAEAINMQYLMPVYAQPPPQKQPPYTYNGYPAPATGYASGPYYHGSQYGSYNY